MSALLACSERPLSSRDGGSLPLALCTFEVTAEVCRTLKINRLAVSAFVVTETRSPQLLRLNIALAFASTTRMLETGQQLATCLKLFGGRFLWSKRRQMIHGHASQRLSVWKQAWTHHGLLRRPCCWVSVVLTGELWRWSPLSSG